MEKQRISWNWTDMIEVSLVVADVKSMISVGLSTMSLVGLNLEQVASRRKQIRILCIGLGGGSLPLFLAHNLPGTYNFCQLQYKVSQLALVTSFRINL